MHLETLDRSHWNIWRHYLKYGALVLQSWSSAAKFSVLKRHILMTNVLSLTETMGALISLELCVIMCFFATEEYISEAS